MWSQLSVGNMKCWGPVTWLTLAALAQAHTGAPGPSSCTLECMKVYTLHHKEFEQVTPEINPLCSC